MIDSYLARIKRFFGTDTLDIQETDFGYSVIKGNWVPSYGISMSFSGKTLNLQNMILHERVLIINKAIGIRSHEEEFQEIISNIGNSVIFQTFPKQDSIKINPGVAIYSVNEDEGFFHGFKVEKTGLLYVAKALKPEYVNGNSFIVPPNSL